MGEAQEKLFRSSARVQKESKQHREGLLDATEVSLEEKMMRAQAIQENNQNVLFTLTELANEFPEIESSLAMALTKENLRLPHRLHRPVSKDNTRNSIEYKLYKFCSVIVVEYH